MENGITSPRTDAFPAGLRVLVVDDDPTWLKILEKMLKKCSYEVTTCGLARDALSLLRERKHGYDIVISDVNMPDMDGFKLLEHVGLEMDLPVIMMSVDGETSRVMKGVQHGACDYLLKPIRMKELRNIWQHVFRKKIHEVRDIELFDDGLFFYGEDTSSSKKRKDVLGKNEDKDHCDSSSSKKARVVWSVDLHQKFVKAVNQIGFDKVGPKKILDLMNVPWLTRENVASHLQKYRLYLSRLQKDDEINTWAAGTKHSDSPLRESPSSFTTQNSISMQENEISKGSFGISGNSLNVQKVEPINYENEREGIVSKNIAEAKRAVNVDAPDPHRPRRSKVKLHGFDTNSSTQFSWCGIPQVQMKQEHKTLHLDEVFGPLQMPGQEQTDVGGPIKVNSSHVQTSSRSLAATTNNPSHVQGSHGSFSTGAAVNSIHVQANHGSSVPTTISSGHVQASHVNPAVTMTNSSHVLQTKTYAPHHKAIEPITASANTSNMKGQDFDMSCISDLESAKKWLTWGASPFPTLDDEMRFCLVQGDCYAMNLGLQNIESPDYYDPGIFPEFQENLYDLSDYALIEQGLFIA